MSEAVIFDVDGTLVDTVDLHAKAWQEAFRDFGHEVGFQEVRSQIGKGGDQLMPVFLSRDELEQKGEALEEHRGKILRERYLPRVTAFPQVRELFERLRRDGKRIALASSAKEDELEVYKKVARIEDLIQTETSSDDAEKSKPHPDIFEAAMKRLGDLRPEDVIVVGDAPYDAEAAGKAGLRTIGLLCGGFPEEELRKAGCIAIYKDPADLLARYRPIPDRLGRRLSIRVMRPALTPAGAFGLTHSTSDAGRKGLGTLGVPAGEAHGAQNRQHRDDNNDPRRQTRHHDPGQVHCNHCGEGRGPGSRDDVVGTHECRPAPQIARHALAGILQGEWLADCHGDQDDQQKASIHG